MELRALTAAEVLRVWEHGAALHAIDRALLLCAFAAPTLDRSSLAALSLGERDALLLTLREGTFGARIEAVVACGNCLAPLELSITVDALRVEVPAGETRLSFGDREVTLRKLDSRDLAAIARMSDGRRARQTLVERGVVGVHHPLSEDEQASVAQRLGEIDPQADLVFDLTCAECQHRFLAPFDVAEFVWSEVSVEARRLLQEVATLARAFTWSEADILSMSRKRRQHYLELASA